MAKTLRQVQHTSPNVFPKVRHALEKDVAERLDTEQRRAFLKMERQYPGEEEALYFLRQIDHSSKQEWAELLGSLRILTSFGAFKGGNTRTLAEATRTREAVLAGLRETILSGGHFRLGVREEGLVVQPDTEEGFTAFALLSLYEQHRLSRLRQCLHCRDWFFARFKHQRFCGDPRKKCQWNHYHTPQWRKQNRERILERNRRHQMEYRKRNPSRRQVAQRSNHK